MLLPHCPCSPDIRLDWETYAPEDREDRLVELLVFYGSPFPLRDQVGNDLLCPETPESSSSCWSPSPSNASGSSQETISSVSRVALARAGGWESAGPHEPQDSLTAG